MKKSASLRVEKVKPDGSRSWVAPKTKESSDIGKKMPKPKDG